MERFEHKILRQIGLAKTLVCLPVVLWGQLSSNARIGSVDIEYRDDKVYVPYSIINSSPNDRYVVWVEFINQKNDRLNAQSVAGDINQVRGNGSKLISWDVKKDGVVLDENISAKLYAKYIPTTSAPRAYLQSTLYPGWGDYQYRPGRPHWLKGFLGYGLTSASALMYIQSNRSFDKYRTSELTSGEDPNFSKAQQQRQVSLICAGAAVAVWVIDYMSIASKASKHKKMRVESVVSDPNYKLYTSLSPSKRINTRGLPPNLFAELSFSDENGNGMLEARERAMLNIALSNQGKGDALQLEVNVSDSTRDGSMVIENPNQKINVIKSGESVKLNIPIKTDINLKTLPHKLTINVLEHYGYDMDPAYLVLNTYAYQPPQLVFSGYEIIDSGAGTGAIAEDGKLQAGEQVKAKLVVQNAGYDIARNTTYAISTTDANIYMENTEGMLGDLKPGEVKEFYITLSPNKRVAARGNLPIYLTLKEDIGKGNLNSYQLPIALNQRPPQTNIVTVKTDVAALKRNVARFEYTSNKFKTNIANIANIKSVQPSSIKRPNSVGVIFGVSSYKELPPAPYADNDARIVKDYFEKVLGVEQVIAYTNDQVAGFIFDDVFNPDNGELQRAVVRGETEVFVFYSGHGIPDKAGENIYLFPQDGKISRLETQGYNIEKLYQNLAKLGAKHVTVILDACFSGGSRKSERIETENLIAQKGVKIRPKNTWLTDPNFTIISSSTGEETSLGFDATETGLFTYYLCAGLQGKADVNGDNQLTLGELKAYVIQNVMDTSKKISGLQTPIFTGDESLVLVKY